MALQSSGAISLDDIHVELDATSGTTVSINDSDVRGLIGKSDEAQSAFNEFYGAANITYMAASGGTTSTSGNYKFHKFTSSGTFTVNTVASGGASTTVDYLIVAGGGAGGQTNSNGYGGGGGGAGGYKTGTVTVSSTGGNSITVGAGYPTLVNNSNISQYGQNYPVRLNMATSGERGGN